MCLGRAECRVHCSTKTEQNPGLFLPCLSGKVVGDADSDKLRGEAVWGEVEPSLGLVFATHAEMGSEFDICTHAKCKHVVAEPSEALRVVEVPSPYHRLRIGGYGSVCAEIASADLVSTLVGLVVGGGVDLVELRFDAEIRKKIEVGVRSKATKSILTIIWPGKGVTSPDLKIALTGGDWGGLSMKDRRSTKQQCQSQLSDHKKTPITPAGQSHLVENNTCPARWLRVMSLPLFFDAIWGNCKTIFHSLLPFVLEAIGGPDGDNRWGKTS